MTSSSDDGPEKGRKGKCLLRSIAWTFVLYENRHVKSPLTKTSETGSFLYFWFFFLTHPSPSISPFFFFLLFTFLHFDLFWFIFYFFPPQLYIGLCCGKRVCSVTAAAAAVLQSWISLHAFCWPASNPPSSRHWTINEENKTCSS